MQLDLIQWDPTVRGVVFGAVFLVPLLAVLWIWYDGSGALDGRRWAWRGILTLAVLLTIPAVVLGAASVDQDDAQLLDQLGILAFGAAGVALLGTIAYAASGRPTQWPQPQVVSAEPYDAWVGAGGPNVAMGDGYGAETTVGAFVGGGSTALAEPPAAPAPGDVRAVIVIKSGPDRGRQIPIVGSATIGRDADATVSLVDSRVSTRHAEIREGEDGHVFIDLASTNGSYLLVEGREERIRRPQRLVDGDEIRVGRTIVQFIQVPGGRAS